jgi:WD40 repeat protein
VVASLNEGTIRVWDADTEQELAATHGGSESRPSCAVFSPDGELVVITNSYPLPVDQFAWSPTTAAVWDTVSGDRGGSFGHQSRAYCAAFSPDGGRVVVGYEDATARVWAAGPFGETLLVLEGHEGTVRGAAFSPDGGRIVTASQDATARVWDAGTGQELLVLGGHEGWVTSAAFSPDGGRIVTASGDTTARMWRGTVDDDV